MPFAGLAPAEGDRVSPAANDERTARHEKAKDRAFIGALLVAVALIGIGIVLISWRGAWAFLGAFLFLFGGSIGAASLIGFTYRRKARRVLESHEWVTTAVKVLARPKSGRNGRTIIELVDPAQSIGVTGLSPEVTNRIEREGRLQYAGDLGGTSMLFVRSPEGEEIYVAVLPRKRETGAEA